MASVAAFAGDRQWFEGLITRQQITDEGVVLLRVHYDDGDKEWEGAADEPFDEAVPAGRGRRRPDAVRFVGAAPAVEAAARVRVGRQRVRARLLALPRGVPHVAAAAGPGPGGGGGFRNQGNDPNQNPTFPPGAVAGPYVGARRHGWSREIPQQLPSSVAGLQTLAPPLTIFAAIVSLMTTRSLGRQRHYGLGPTGDRFWNCHEQCAARTKDAPVGRRARRHLGVWWL